MKPLTKEDEIAFRIELENNLAQKEFRKQGYKFFWIILHTVGSAAAGAATMFFYLMDL